MLVRLTALCAIAALGLLAAGPVRAASAGAAIAAPAPSDVSSQQRRPRAPTRIRVVPLSGYHRECVAWYQLERRPSGDVVTPQIHCQWVR